MAGEGGPRSPSGARRAVVAGVALACVLGLACVLAVRCAAPGAGVAGDGAAGESRKTDATGAAEPVRSADPAVIQGLTVPGACEGAHLVETAGSGMGVRATWSVGVSVDDAARSVLEGYERDEDMHLGRAEYIDLYGRVWSCVVSSSRGWSETVLVDGRGSDDDASCKVTVVRLAASSEQDGAYGVDGAVEAAVASGLAAAAAAGSGE